MDYLDLTLDLVSETYKPFNKPNNNPAYVHVESNHPPAIIKQIPISISKRISNNSSSKEIFDNAAPYYNNALEKSGYKEKISYCPTTNTNNAPARRKRSRKIIWFNPPYSKDVETNVAKTFLNLIDKHFKRDHKYYPIFNRNNVKVSYGCMDNMNKILKAHNSKVTRETTLNVRTCNCRNRDQCPLDGKCLTPNLVYNAEVSTDSDDASKDYIGISKPPFKERFGVHKKSFNDRGYDPSSLSEYIWELKDKGVNYNIQWTILRKTSGYNSVTKSCSLCLTEKLLIAEHPDKGKLINKRNELVSKCRHEDRYLLQNYSAID